MIFLLLLIASTLIYPSFQSFKINTFSTPIEQETTIFDNDSDQLTYSNNFDKTCKV